MMTLWENSTLIAILPLSEFLFVLATYQSALTTLADLNLVF